MQNHNLHPQFFPLNPDMPTLDPQQLVAPVQQQQRVPASNPAMMALQQPNPMMPMQQYHPGMHHHNPQAMAMQQPPPPSPQQLLAMRQQKHQQQQQQQHQQQFMAMPHAQQMPQQMPQPIPQQIPQQVPQQMAQQMSQTIPQTIPGQMMPNGGGAPGQHQLAGQTMQFQPNQMAFQFSNQSHPSSTDLQAASQQNQFSVPTTPALPPQPTRNPGSSGPMTPNQVPPPNGHDLGATASPHANMLSTMLSRSSTSSSHRPHPTPKKSAQTGSNQPTDPRQSRPTEAGPPRTNDGDADLQQDRFELLLQINTELLKHAISLHAQGKGGAVSLQPGAQQPEKSAMSKPASPEYIKVMRYIQANLTYMAAVQKAAPGMGLVRPGPPLMSHPTELPELAPLYKRLQELFPNWKGVSTMPKPAGLDFNQQQQPQQQQQQPVAQQGGNVAHQPQIPQSPFRQQQGQLQPQQPQSIPAQLHQQQQHPGMAPTQPGQFQQQQQHPQQQQMMPLQPGQMPGHMQMQLQQQQQQQQQQLLQAQRAQAQRMQQAGFADFSGQPPRMGMPGQVGPTNPGQAQVQPPPQPHQMPMMNPHQGQQPNANQAQQQQQQLQQLQYQQMQQQMRQRQYQQMQQQQHQQQQQQQQPQQQPPF